MPTIPTTLIPLLLIALITTIALSVLIYYQRKYYKQTKELLARTAKAISEYKDDDRLQRKSIETQRLQSLVGKPVYACSNEWDDPIVGFVTRIEFVTQAGNPIPVIKNYLTGNEVLCFGIMHVYTEYKFNAFLKLNPYERWMLLANQEYSWDGFEQKAVMNKNILTAEEIITTLKKADFFKDVLAVH